MSDNAERERELAEMKREAGEDERRHAEGGPSNKVPGFPDEPGRVESEELRVVAEEERVAAEEKRSDMRSFYYKLAATVALPLAFIALVPSLVGIYLVQAEAKERSAQNRALIEQANKTQKQLVAGFKRADVIGCREIEKLKAENRQKAQQTYNRRFQTYRLLNLQPTEELEQLAFDILNADLERNKSRNCGALPPAVVE